MGRRDFLEVSQVGKFPHNQVFSESVPQQTKSNQPGGRNLPPRAFGSADQCSLAAAQPAEQNEKEES